MSNHALAWHRLCRSQCILYVKAYHHTPFVKVNLFSTSPEHVCIMEYSTHAVYIIRYLTLGTATGRRNKKIVKWRHYDDISTTCGDWPTGRESRLIRTRHTKSGYADCWMFPSINNKQIRKGYLYINTEANYRKLRHLHVRVQACKYLHVSPHAVDSVRLRVDYQS